MFCEPYKSCSLFGALRIVANLKNVASIIPPAARFMQEIP